MVDVEKCTVGKSYILQRRWRKEQTTAQDTPEGGWEAEFRTYHDPAKLAGLRARLADRQKAAGDKLEFRIILRTETWEDEVVE